jgi:ribokinase
VDLTVSVPRFLKPGETMTGTKFAVFTGGKGGNQAVAAAGWARTWP